MTHCFSPADARETKGHEGLPELLCHGLEPQERVGTLLSQQKGLHIQPLPQLLRHPGPTGRHTGLPHWSLYQQRQPHHPPRERLACGLSKECGDSTAGTPRSHTGFPLALTAVSSPQFLQTPRSSRGQQGDEAPDQLRGWPGAIQAGVYTWRARRVTQEWPHRGSDSVTGP